MRILLWCLMIGLSALGATELIRLGVFRLLRPEKDSTVALVIVPKNGEDCEQLIRAALARLDWMDWGVPCKVICLNPQDDAHVEAVCNILHRRNPGLLLSKREDLVYNILRNEES